MTVTVRGNETETASRHPLLDLRQEDDSPSQPPEPTWLVEEDDGYFVVWDGDDPTLTIEEYDRPTWTLVLELWNRYREFSPLEKALVASELSDELSEEERRTLADQLDLPASEPLFSALTNVREYPEALRDRLHDGDVSLRVIRYLDYVPEPIRNVLVEGMSNGSVNLSVQEIRQLEEAARRLSEDQIDEWVKTAENRDYEENAREAGRALLSLTRDMAYPRTRKRRENFEAALESLDVDGRITVTPPTNFEGDHLDFRLRCRRDEDLITLAEELKRCKKLLKHL